MYYLLKKMSAFIGAASLTMASASLFASSHMDAPLITFDDPANTTDVYAFRSESEDGSQQYLTTALSVYPFEEPGIGPNNYRFDDNVLYQIHVALGKDVDKGKPTISYQFQFKTEFINKQTILQSFLGPLNGDDNDGDGFDDNQNLRQIYTLTKVNRKNGKRVVLGKGLVPPNNQGLVTPKYNQFDNGENPAKEGVDAEFNLDDYTRNAIANLDWGYRTFAGQRDDGFYADIQSIFDLDFTFGGPNKPFDSQGGYNVHTIVMQIPMDELKSDRAGVYATTSRRKVSILPFKNRRGKEFGPFVQVGRQGYPLFNEALVSIEDKDLYNRTSPKQDSYLFKKYALEPELAAALGLPDNLRTNRTDIAGIFIPDVIKVDLTTGPVPLAGPINDAGFSRLSLFGGDNGGFPNGRRFGDDVVDIAVCAILSDLRDPNNIIINPACDPAQNPDIVTVGIDRVVENDISFNKVMPYAATPLNGRNHNHH